MRRLATAIWLALVIGPVYAQTPSGRGTVAIVPTVNASGEKWAQLRDRQCRAIDEWAYEHFSKAGYAPLPATQVQDVLRRLDVDMTDEENWRREAIRRIGQEAGSDYVLFCAITFTEQKEQRRTWYKDKEGRTDVRVWLIEVESATPILTGKTYTGRSGGNRITFNNKGSDRQVQAAANAVRDAARAFLAPYRVK